jgi:hypothetical protein
MPVSEVKWRTEQLVKPQQDEAEIIEIDVYERRIGGGWSQRGRRTGDSIGGLGR